MSVSVSCLLHLWPYNYVGNWKRQGWTKCIKKRLIPLPCTFHRMKASSLCFNSRLALHTANTGYYKGLGFANNLYKPAVISYGRSILVIVLVLYLALDGGCCIVTYQPVTMHL